MEYGGFSESDKAAGSGETKSILFFTLKAMDSCWFQTINILIHKTFWDCSKNKHF